MHTADITGVYISDYMLYYSTLCVKPNQQICSNLNLASCNVDDVTLKGSTSYDYTYLVASLAFEAARMEYHYNVCIVQ